MNLPRGTLVLVGLSPTVGHEQRGSRPGVIVSDSGAIRGPMSTLTPSSSES
ncbi:MAG TPA: type II toxin-antitoxin system PemK/MazF family toxin [Thermoanaerobaculia bacterium]